MNKSIQKIVTLNINVQEDLSKTTRHYMLMSASMLPLKIFLYHKYV